MSRISCCPECDGKNYTSFRWELKASLNFPELVKYRMCLAKRGKLKVGSLWECGNCHNKWYLDVHGSMMYHVPKEREDLLGIWNEKRLAPKPEWLRVLGEIGASPPDIYGNDVDIINIPCRVVDCDGNSFDPAMIRFQTGPPIEDWFPNVRLLDSISHIEHSDFALPAEVRIASTEAGEVGMGFAPTIIVAPDGSEFCLNWTTDFFLWHGLKAASMKLADAPHSFKPDTHIIDNSHAKAAIFLGDWNDDLVSLRLKTNVKRSTSPFQVISTQKLGS